MISNNNNNNNNKRPVRENTKSKRDRKASGDFEHKIAGFKKVTFISSRCFRCCWLLLYIAQTNAYNFPLPKNGQNCRLVLLKTFVKSAQNQSLSGEICSENFLEIGFFFNNRFSAKFDPNFPRNSREIGRFFHEFVPENPTKFDFFSATYQRLCVMNGLRNKSS